MKRGPQPRTAEERFWSKVGKTDSCWLWRGSCHPDGHGWFYLGRENGKLKATYAHRFSWTLHGGGIKNRREQVLHKCDVPACVNPAHLYIGDWRRNAQDAVERGQIKTGERHHNAKLTDEQVRRIKDIGRSNRLEELGLLFGINFRTVSKILNGQSWKHLA